MPSGVITNLDINFSNSSGASHKATVRAVEALDAWDFKNALIPPTAVQGEINEKLTFGDPDIETLLSKFTTTEIVKSTDSVKTSIEFNMQDNLSLKLDSIIIALRAKDVGPLGEEEFEGNIYNWTELPDNIKYSTRYTEELAPWGQNGETRGSPDYQSYVERGTANPNNEHQQKPEWRLDKRTLVLGQIYNIVELEDQKGEIWTKAYIHRERAFFLELPPKNDVWFINYTWPAIADPEEDRGSWQDSRIQLGYTLKELTEGLDEIGILWEGIPLEEEFLIEESGTLTDVLSSAASKLGYYWYIDPILEKVIWIDSLGVEALTVTDYNETTDQKIVSTSFTDNIIKSANVISYNTTLQETRREQPQRTQKDRKLKKAFKRLEFNKEIESVLEYFIGVYYLMWNKDLLSEDYFDKLWFYGMHYSNDFRSAAEHLEYEDELLEQQDDLPWDLKEIRDDYGYIEEGDKETPDNLKLREQYKILKEFITISRDGERALPVFNYAYRMEKKDAVTEKGIQKPSEGVWYRFLKNYMDSGLGGLYMSGPVSKYRSDRIVWEGGDDWEVIGGWRWDALLADIPELAPIAEFLEKYTATSKEWLDVKDFAKNLYADIGYNEETWSEDKYYYFAIRKNSRKFLETQAQDIINTFDDRIGARIIETSVNQKNWLLFQNKEAVNGYVTKSRDEYDAKLLELPLEEYGSIRYRRLRHPVKDERHSDTEDNDVSTDENYDDLDLNRENKIIKIKYPEIQLEGGGVNNPIKENNPLTLENVSAESEQELDAIERNKSSKLSFLNQQQSSRVIFDLEIPTFSPEISSISLNFTADGITTTIVESTINILPTDQSIIITRDNLTRRSTNPLSKASAKKKNLLNL